MKSDDNKSNVSWAVVIGLLACLALIMIIALYAG
jgi:hypothetical protein